MPLAKKERKMKGNSYDLTIDTQLWVMYRIEGKTISQIVLL
jgi:hypothetical protein